MRLRAAWWIVVACAALGIETAGGQEQTNMDLPEPNMELASGWWRSLENYCTPVGWKDHVCRFNILYDGSIVVLAHRHQNRLPGDARALFRLNTREPQAGSDDNYVLQGWNESNAPVLWSEWVREGLVLRSEVFAHLPGGGEIASGTEPLFLWLRLSVHDICDGLPHPGTAVFGVQINLPAYELNMSKRLNMSFDPTQSAYPRTLVPDRPEYDPAQGFRLVEEGERVRLGVAPGQACYVAYSPNAPTERDNSLGVHITATKDSHVDLLIPFLPLETAVFDEELSLGYDAALAEAERFWSRVPATAATFAVPEDYVTQAIRRQLQFAEIIAERDPNTGSYSLLTGSWGYSWGLWPTPNALTMNLLDTMGYHSAVEKYLEIFRTEQGTIVAPGSSFKPHPGYFSSPKTLTSIDWLSDHGAILWVAAQHGLLTDDRAFINRWLPHIVKACEFIQDARRSEGHGGIEGILPPAVATDQSVAVQAIWSDGWNYKGLRTAARLLWRVRHPRAAEFEEEADRYRDTFVKTLRDKTRTMPEWTDADGGRYNQVPTAFLGEQEWQLRHPFHLDTGPLFLVFAGLFEADDVLMRSTLAWFREGPPTKLYRHESDCWQLPSLWHEVSSCEPCYSWNVFHSWRLKSRYRFLEGMYSLLAGAMSRETYSVCETRGGLTGITPCVPVGLLARLAVVDDQLEENALHLLRLMPLAWLDTARAAEFENLPTEFGPVTLRVQLADGGQELQVTYSGRFRTAPERTELHVPPVRGLKRIVVNGAALEWDGETQITL